MAKPTILKDRHTGEEMYPHTLASLVKTSDGHNVDEGLTTKQDAFTTSEDLQISPDNELSLTERAKRAVFIDEWILAGSNDGCNKVYAGYDTANAPDNEHPFFVGNADGKVWLTYKEALDCYRYYSAEILDSLQHRFTGSNMKAALLVRSNASNPLDCIRAFINCKNLEIVVFYDLWAKRTTEMFYGCSKLRAILGSFAIESATDVTGMFSKCYDLEYFPMVHVKKNVSFQDCPKLKRSCFELMMPYTSEGVTFTVHADVYAKLTGDTTNEAAAALTPEELAQWQQVLADAVAKNISFATL